MTLRYALLPTLLAFLTVAPALAQVSGSQAAARSDPSHGDSTFVFASLEWGTDRSEVRRSLTEQGYHFYATTPDGVYDTFTGTPNRADTIVVAAISDEGLEKVHVALAPSSEGAVFDLFDRVTTELALTHGEPVEAYGYFAPPFEEGDGRELEAIRSENAVFIQGWDAADGSSIIAEISKAVTVTIGYEGPGWSAFLESLQQ